MNKRDILRTVFGRQIETTDHSMKLQPVREAAIRFVAEILACDPSPTGDGLKAENIAAIDKVFESLAWVTRGVVTYPDAADRMKERVELFETIIELGEDRLSRRGVETIGQLFGLEIEFPGDDDEEESQADA